MTRLLVSVRDAAEADLAAAAGADLIDAKDPSVGSLGSLPPAAIGAILHVVGARAPVSAVAGEHEALEPLVAAARAVAATGVAFVKVGLSRPLAAPDAAAAIGSALAGIRLVAVLFADEAPDLGLVPSLAQAGFAGAMLDTRRKGAGRLVEVQPPAALAAFVAACRAEALMCGLAGSLRLDDIAALAPLGPDYLGFRGGLCAGADRRAGLDAGAIAAAAARIRSTARAAA
ncbi:(5-formylfuran-3-yl)methyl phosphate synthase [Labrys wisconsinensis]|uniref:(5-formylfuran-3-yl)methyl phosphate synthase n=1 Tax=Labrys wisconsinensis TaxID=425677 RepID=A0ABU0IYJ3_9HYPH|nr:(5-formylfuran-3-yl)methyl phosphate synthase [Labrys wisconsinensis]MDQ0467079.1 uncharacterized protein (UPF0264 family) [Labrys wisconsinensis]